MSVRIAGGALAGRSLTGPPRARSGRRNRAGPEAARPTAVRLRKSLFEVLADEFDGIRVLDVCAGVGTLGFEAISRGARECVFVERSPPLARLVERNASRLGLSSFRVVVGDGVRELRRLRAAGEDFGVVLLDPPWADWETEAGTRLLAEAIPLAPLVVAEHRASWSPPPEVGSGLERTSRAVADALAAVRTRTTRVGDGAFSLYRWVGTAEKPRTLSQTEMEPVLSRSEAEFAPNVEKSPSRAGKEPPGRS